jgi:hypothetical protein
VDNVSVAADLLSCLLVDELLVKRDNATSTYRRQLPIG